MKNFARRLWILSLLLLGSKQRLAGVIMLLLAVAVGAWLPRGAPTVDSVNFSSGARTGVSWAERFSASLGDVLTQSFGSALWVAIVITGLWGVLLLVRGASWDSSPRPQSVKLVPWRLALLPLVVALWSGFLAALAAEAQLHAILGGWVGMTVHRLVAWIKPISESLYAISLGVWCLILLASTLWLSALSAREWWWILKLPPRLGRALTLAGLSFVRGLNDEANATPRHSTEPSSTRSSPTAPPSVFEASEVPPPPPPPLLEPTPQNLSDSVPSAPLGSSAEADSKAGFWKGKEAVDLPDSIPKPPPLLNGTDTTQADAPLNEPTTTPPPLEPTTTPLAPEPATTPSGDTQSGGTQLGGTPSAEPTTASSAESMASPSASQKPPTKPAAAPTEPPKPEKTTPCWQLPPLNLLDVAPSALSAPPQFSLERAARKLEKTLKDFRVQGQITAIRPGPVVTLFELEPAPGTKASRVIGLADDVARSLGALSVRIDVIPGRTTIGIELPNPQRETVLAGDCFREATLEALRRKHSELPILLGRTIDGKPLFVHLATMPHLLVAGTTGSGKSVGVNAMVLSLLLQYVPDECRLVMIDPKMLEFSVYENIPHLLSPVVNDPKRAVSALKWAVTEMERRYYLLSEGGVRNLASYNAQRDKHDPETRLPYIVIVVDEFADLMMTAGKEVEAPIQRLSQKARAAGIHLIMATQRPSVDVVTGTIKANLPTRISYQVTSKIDSRTILGEQGAETLLGRGDMLYMAPGQRLRRVHGPLVSEKEIKAVCDFLRPQGEPDYVDSVLRGASDDDEDSPPNGKARANADNFTGATDFAAIESDEDAYESAVRIVVVDGRASTSYLQRKLQIGYNRAARLMEQMERDGVVSSASPTGKREILMSRAALGLADDDE